MLCTNCDIDILYASCGVFGEAYKKALLTFVYYQIGWYLRSVCVSLFGRLFNLLNFWKTNKTKIYQIFLLWLSVTSSESMDLMVYLIVQGWYAFFKKDFVGKILGVLQVYYGCLVLHFYLMRRTNLPTLIPFNF